MSSTDHGRSSDEALDMHENVMRPMSLISRFFGDSRLILSVDCLVDAVFKTLNVLDFQSNA